MSLAITQSSEFNPSDVGFSKLRKNKNGGKAVYLNKGGNNKLFIEFPKLRCPYGLSAFTDESTGRTSYSLDLAFDTDNAEAMELRKKFEQLDEIIVNKVAEHSTEWLGKAYNVEVLKQALYKPLVRVGKEEYPATIKLKVLTKSDGSFVPETYNMQRESISLDSIEKGAKVYTIVDLNQIWFIDNKFGVTIRLSQALVEQSAKLPSFAFQGVSIPEPSNDAAVDDEEEDFVDEE
ncbi:hypothetical protein [Dishui Lake phycodnavirus 2]|nr:hypothetical protein [Dishui Lake phycodnavirus 2]